MRCSTAGDTATRNMTTEGVPWRMQKLHTFCGNTRRNWNTYWHLWQTSAITSKFSRSLVKDESWQQILPSRCVFSRQHIYWQEQRSWLTILSSQGQTESNSSFKSRSSQSPLLNLPHKTRPLSLLIPTTMSNPFSLPSYFTSPFVTTIPGSRYDSRGRQLNFEESNVQRRERLAFLNASKSAGTSPIQSPSSSSSGSPIVRSTSPIASWTELIKPWGSKQEGHSFLSLSLILSNTWQTSWHWSLIWMTSCHLT